MSVEIECECDPGSWTGRVMGGTFEGAHDSRWVCDDCRPLHEADVGRSFDDVRFIPKGAKT